MFAGRRALHLQDPAFPADLAEFAQSAVSSLERSRVEVSEVMTKYQLRLPDRQCKIAEISGRIQDMVVMLTTSLWAGRQTNETVRAAAEVLCQDLQRKLTGERPTNQHYRAITKLGEMVASGGFAAVAGIDAGEIMMPYEA
jgi:hypothetical protein